MWQTCLLLSESSCSCYLASTFFSLLKNSFLSPRQDTFRFYAIKLINVKKKKKMRKYNIQSNFFNHKTLSFSLSFNFTFFSFSLFSSHYFLFFCHCILLLFLPFFFCFFFCFLFANFVAFFLSPVLSLSFLFNHFLKIQHWPKLIR